MIASTCWVNSWWPLSSNKAFWLRLFGAQIGRNVVIKPFVNVKYPWRLRIADDVWIGEHVWIDNLADVTLDANVCVSQGALLLCGNHNYSKSSFDLIVGEIHLKEGAWVGAKALVCPGTTLETHAVVAAGSVISGVTGPYAIYKGNPAVKVKTRHIG